MTTTEAHKVLQGSFSKDKHQILWERGVNYARLGEREKKGSILIREVRSTLGGLAQGLTFNLTSSGGYRTARDSQLSG